MAKLWVAFDEMLGRRGEHDGQVLRSIRSSEHADNGRDAASACFALAALLGGSTAFLGTLRFHENEVAQHIERLNACGHGLLRARGGDLRRLLAEARIDVDRVREGFQGNLLRCAEGGPELNVATTLQVWLVRSGMVASEEMFLGASPRIAFVCAGVRWKGTHYLPLCSLLQEKIADSINNAHRLSAGTFAYNSSDGAVRAPLWIDVVQREDDVILRFLSRAPEETLPGQSVVPLPQLEEIGVTMERRAIAVPDEGVLYEVKIRIPWLEALSRQEQEVVS